MIIGLFGFDFTSSNKGCEALTYTFLSMMERLFDGEQLTVYNFTYNETLGIVPKQYPNIVFHQCNINLKNPEYWIKAFNTLKKCEAFFDATFGDGFSDIYGKKWNVKTDLIKQMVLWSGTPLVLVPQTYGPYSDALLKKWAMRLIRKADLVYSRDNISASIILEQSGTRIKVASDMAFKLPYDKSMYKFDNPKIKVGINVSSLLWDSTWAKENHFGLSVDYQQYHSELIEWLIKQSIYDIHIIPHVIDLSHPDARENDYRVCMELKERYNNRVIIAPPFDTPIEAKSYISNMDIFIGSRMHATIGAISSGVATIPFSYSRKFEGLFGNIDYPYVISTKEITLKEVLDKTRKWIQDYEELKQQGNKSVQKAFEKLEELEKDIKYILVKQK